MPDIATPLRRKKTSRRYDSPLRAEQARQTRLRILDAARDVLKREGFARVTLDTIARAAGVSVQTVLANFGNKAGLFEALMQRDMESDFTGILEAVRAESDTRRKLRVTADFFTRIHVAHAPRGSGALLPEPVGGSAGLRRILQERAVYLRSLAEELFTGVPLREGLSIGKAVALLEAYAGPPLYMILVRYYGWTNDEFRLWLGNALIDALLPPECRDGEAHSLLPEEARRQRADPGAKHDGDDGKTDKAHADPEACRAGFMEHDNPREDGGRGLHDAEDGGHGGSDTLYGKNKRQIG